MLTEFGAVGESLEDVELLHLQAAGADAGLLAVVSYTPLTNREVLALFTAVAAAVPGFPLVI